MNNVVKAITRLGAGFMALSMLSIGAMAADITDTDVSGTNETPYLTPEQTQEALADNAKIDAFYDALQKQARSARANNQLVLGVPQCQQETKYWCGPASVEMVMEYLTGRSYSQSSLAKAIGTTSDGSSSDQLCTYLTNQGYSYQVSNLSTSNLSSSISYSISNYKPMICSVKEMPDYTTSGHFICITGYKLYTDGKVQTVFYNDPHWRDEYFGANSMSYSEMYDAINSNMGKFIRYNG